MLCSLLPLVRQVDARLWQLPGMTALRRGDEASKGHSSGVVHLSPEHLRGSSLEIHFGSARQKEEAITELEDARWLAPLLMRVSAGERARPYPQPSTDRRAASPSGCARPRSRSRSRSPRRRDPQDAPHMAVRRAGGLKKPSGRRVQFHTATVNHCCNPAYSTRPRLGAAASQSSSQGGQEWWSFLDAQGNESELHTLPQIRTLVSRGIISPTMLFERECDDADPQHMAEPLTMTVRRLLEASRDASRTRGRFAPISLCEPMYEEDLRGSQEAAAKAHAEALLLRREVSDEVEPPRSYTFVDVVTQRVRGPFSRVQLQEMFEPREVLGGQAVSSPGQPECTLMFVLHSGAAGGGDAATDAGVAHAHAPPAAPVPASEDALRRAFKSAVERLVGMELGEPAYRNKEASRQQLKDTCKWVAAKVAEKCQQCGLLHSWHRSVSSEHSFAAFLEQPEEKLKILKLARGRLAELVKRAGGAVGALEAAEGSTDGTTIGSSAG